MDNVTKSTSAMPVTGIILAGGQSSRMRQDKGLSELGGRKLIEIALTKLIPMCESVIISSNSDVYQQFGFKVIRDIIPCIGPIGGIYSALKESNTELNLVLSVDLPFVNEGLLKYLLEEEAGSQVTLPRSGEEFVEPLCVCYHSSVLPILEDFISKKKFKLQEFVMNVNMNSLIINACLPFYEAHSFHNINTPSDLFIARKILKVT